MNRCLVDGEAVDAIPVSDRGLHYGDGLFETIAMVDNQPLYWEAHLARLAEGCLQFGMPLPPVDLLRNEVRTVVNRRDRCVVKIIVTRGTGGRGYLAPEPCEPRRIVMSFDWPEYPDSYYLQGVQLRLCATRLCCQPLLAGLKHLNRLENVLARREWQEPDIAEGLMCNAAGDVIEGTMSNLFLVSDGQLQTPALDQCGVRGVLRSRIIELAAELDIPHQQLSVRPVDLDDADELFVCNSIIGIWPARMAASDRICPGPITRRLMQHLVENDNLIMIR